MYSKNEILVFEDYCKIILRDRNGKAVGQAIVDRDDYFKVAKIKWDKTNSGYAIGHSDTTKKKVLLHNLLIGAREGYVIDHINRNKLDNRKENLRHATRSMNCFNSFLNKNNTSGVRGVCYSNKINKWIATMCHNNKNYFLGSSKDFMEAVKLRQKKEKELLGKVMEY